MPMPCVRRLAVCPIILFILFLFFPAGCGKKGALIAPEDVLSKERSQPQGNEPSAPGPQPGSQERSQENSNDSR